LVRNIRLYCLSLKQCTSNALSITSAISYSLPSKEKVTHYLQPLHNPTYQPMYHYFSLQTIRHIPHMPLKPTRIGKGLRMRPGRYLPAPSRTVVTHPRNIHYPHCRIYAWWVVFRHKCPTWFRVLALVNVHHLSTHVKRYVILTSGRWICLSTC
jgi:hypothetical protein